MKINITVLIKYVLFYHDLNGERVLVLGITENDTRDFKIVLSKKEIQKL